MSRSGDLVDYVLGQGDAAERARARAEIEADLAQATEVAELSTLFEGMRSLTVEPSGRVPLAVRYAVMRHAAVHGGRPATRRESFRFGLLVAAVAASWLCVSMLTFGGSHEAVRGPAVVGLAFAAEPPPQPSGAVDSELAALLSATELPVDDESFVTAYERFGLQPIPDDFRGWLSADNLVARLREEYTLRFSASRRRLARTATGSPDLEDRIAALADTVARRLAFVLAADAATSPARRPETGEIAIGLRALLATGSTTEIGPHRDVAHACVRLLSRRLPQLDGGELATALAALAELAVVDERRVVELVSTHGDRLAREVLRPRESGRPPLLSWQTPLAALADAGRVLQLAPGFGVHAGLAFRARLLVAVHLEERLELHAGEERPEIVAARLYGFGDLIDRRAADRMLKLWRPEYLQDNFVVLHHVAWGKYPVRSGWAEFQRELQRLAGVPTPEGIRGAGALLLCLSMNSAAPGVLEAPRLSEL